jgi:hypothetical protein
MDSYMADVTRQERENPTHNLPDHVKNDLQAQIDQLRK